MTPQILESFQKTRPWVLFLSILGFVLAGFMFLVGILAPMGIMASGKREAVPAGIGMCIAANKVKGIRAAQCYDAFTAQRARRHNDAQICCLSAEEGKVRVPAILEKFLTTEFEGGRHIARINKIKEIEEHQYSK